MLPHKTKQHVAIFDNLAASCGLFQFDKGQLLLKVFGEFFENVPRTQIFLIKFGNTLHSSITPKTLIIQSHLYKKSLNFNEIIVLLKGACLNSSRFWLPSQSLIFMTYRYKLLQNPNGSILPLFDEFLQKSSCQRTSRTIIDEIRYAIRFRALQHFVMVFSHWQNPSLFPHLFSSRSIFGKIFIISIDSCVKFA